MKSVSRLITLSATWIIVSLVATLHAQESPRIKRTALDEYIARPDPSYSWKLVNTTRGDGVTTFIVDLHSQTWRVQPDVDRPLWQHWVTIVKPDTVKYDTAFLNIGGGRNGGAPPAQASARSVQYAKSSQSVVIDLGMIPNQPLIFNNDGKPRVEDDLIAYCWIKYMDTGDVNWLVRLPMVKSVVRAMDAATELLAGEPGGKTMIKKFVVMGGSKRGWTTWLTGAVDPRVSAIVPAVIDVVNVQPSMQNHYSAYGYWAAALKDYNEHKIHERAETPRYQEILQIVDPYTYRDRLTMPKFIVNAAGDQYFTPDSSKFYFDDLKGVKYLRYVPNANHSLSGSDAGDSVLMFYEAILKGTALPKFSWKLQSDGSLRVETKDKPMAVNLWQANNPKARDFRLESIGKAYQSSVLTDEGGGVYVAKVPKPPQGWTAFFVEMVYNSGGSAPFKFTTQVQIVPDTLPFSYEDYRKTLKK